MSCRGFFRWDSYWAYQRSRKYDQERRPNGSVHSFLDSDGESHKRREVDWQSNDDESYQVRRKRSSWLIIKIVELLIGTRMALWVWESWGTFWPGLGTRCQRMRWLRWSGLWTAEPRGSCPAGVGCRIFEEAEVQSSSPKFPRVKSQKGKIN